MKKQLLASMINFLVLAVLLVFIASCNDITPAFTTSITSSPTDTPTITTIYEPLARTDDSAYKTFVSTNESIIHFSFQYPSSYILVDESKGKNNPSLIVHFSATIDNEFGERAYKYIDIWIRNYLDKWMGFPEAKTQMYKTISSLKSQYERFRLIEKNKAVVDGIEGWEIITRYAKPFYKDTYHGWTSPAAMIIERELFFDYKNMTWNIRLYTDEESYEEQTKADFEYVLRTFKFPEKN
jgi:hypothetical protein